MTPETLLPHRPTEDTSTPAKIDRKLHVSYVVTFEFDRRPPLTHRGTLAATTSATCAARALREAKKALKPNNWQSLVCVLTKRSVE